MRKIGLDIGEKSCGIALSDEMNIIASGMENYIFETHKWSMLLDKVAQYIDKYEIDVIVIGYPTLPSGDKSTTTLMIEGVETLLKERFKQPVIRIDENMSTKRAQETLKSAGLNNKKRKALKDQLAAQFILTDYLNMI
ncbi:MAG: Holliday junction resolvase RuvX [Mycoplasmataceae bacterium]|nr:Holliday junction resolvase RuvX [Mycoplasmataceae bacterium]